MMKLSELQNELRDFKPHRRVGRGISSGRGKTCGRGTKGAGARSGYKRRYGYEGGQFRLYMKLPIRGFSNERFRKRYDAINLDLIDKLFEDGEVVNLQTLRDLSYIKGVSYGLKILGKGELKKKVRIEAASFSDSAKQKLQQENIEFIIVE